jgi:hypothetical protein
MLNQFQEPENNLRYDSQMQQRVVERAARLQQEDHDHQTVDQLLDAASEIGLQPHYVQQAIAQIKAEQRVMATIPLQVTRPVSHSRTEFRRFVAAMSMPFAVGALAFTLKDFTGLAVLNTLILPAPLACLSGFLTGRKRVGFVTAALLVLCLAPTAYHLGIHDFYRSLPDQVNEINFAGRAKNIGQEAAFFYMAFGILPAGLLGAFGAWTRKRYLPHSLPEINP